MRVAILLILFVLTTSSCTPIFKALYGIKKVRPVEEEKILTYAKSLGFENVYFIDSSFIEYADYISTNLGGDSISAQIKRKNILQPIQLLVFDHSNKVVSYFVNCYATGFPNLKWNKNNEFLKIPPITMVDVPKNVYFNQLIKYFKPLKMAPKTNTNYSYKYVIFGNFFMKRQSENLIRQVKQSTQNNDKVILMYVNNDRLYYD